MPDSERAIRGAPFVEARWPNPRGDERKVLFLEDLGEWVLLLLEADQGDVAVGRAARRVRLLEFSVGREDRPVRQRRLKAMLPTRVEHREDATVTFVKIVLQAGVLGGGEGRGRSGDEHHRRVPRHFGDRGEVQLADFEVTVAQLAGE